MVVYAGDNNFTEYSANFTVNVNKVAPVVTVSDAIIKYLEDASFTITTDVPGYYTLFINNVNVTIVKVGDPSPFPF